jgi:hypothetical protein
VIPGVQWVWVLVLAVLGAFVLFVGVDKVSVAVGPSLVAAAALSMLRQGGAESEPRWIARLARLILHSEHSPTLAPH